MNPGVATLNPPVDPSRDHVRGPADAPVTLVEYGDFQCPYCGDAYPVVQHLAERFGDALRFVFRHMPLDTWTRTENWRNRDEVATAQEQERDELRELMAALTLSPQVAGVTYPRGCRIRRVRVAGAKPEPRADQTVILSRRALEEARNATR